jgi:hypothetical protein
MTHHRFASTQKHRFTLEAQAWRSALLLLIALAGLTALGKEFSKRT